MAPRRIRGYGYTLTGRRKWFRQRTAPQKREGAGRKDDDMSNPMWVHILRLLDDEEQATMVHQIFKQAMITRAIETDLSDRSCVR